MTVSRLHYNYVLDDEVEYTNYVNNKLNELYGYKSEYCIKYAEAEGAEVFFARDDNGKINGILVLVKGYDMFKEETTLYQRLFFADTHRASYALFQHFLDYSKTLGHALRCVLTEHTNIKASTLEKYGLEKYETVYKLKES